VTLLLWLGGISVSIASFLFGKIFSQSENILEQKRRVYEQFILVCPSPQEAHSCDVVVSIELQRQIGILCIYGSPDVAKFAGDYFSEFGTAQEILIDVAEPGHPKFLELMTNYNRLIWAMRTDAMTWSLFAPAKSAKVYDTPVSRMFKPNKDEI